LSQHAADYQRQSGLQTDSTAMNRTHATIVDIVSMAKPPEQAQNSFGPHGAEIAI
jgi:hypothetical protein